MAEDKLSNSQEPQKDVPATPTSQPQQTSTNNLVAAVPPPPLPNPAISPRMIKEMDQRYTERSDDEN